MEQGTGIMENISGFLGSVRQYLEDKIELEVLKASNRLARLAAVAGTLILAAALGLLILVFLLAGIALAFNEWTNSGFWGYFIAAAMALLILWMLLAGGKRRIHAWVLNYILSNLEDEE